MGPYPFHTNRREPPWGHTLNRRGNRRGIRPFPKLPKLLHCQTRSLPHLPTSPRGQTLPHTAPTLLCGVRPFTITLHSSFFILYLNYLKLSCKKDFTVILQLFYKDVPLFWYFISVGEITLAERDK